MEGLEAETERRTLTFSKWENHVKDVGREGWHPVTYNFQDSTLEAIRSIQVCGSVIHQFKFSSPLKPLEARSVLKTFRRREFCVVTHPSGERSLTGVL